MKNVLLCLLALTIALGGYAQQKPVLKGDVKSNSAISPERIGWEPVKTKPVTSSTSPALFSVSLEITFLTGFP
ncbi:MAG: hypothetical protein HGA37_16525 [Lentimicrobium sp.]|nr:hypothetical protein [Lentimicrobium sp.]